MQPLSDRLKPDCLSELDFDRLLADERKGTARLTAHVASCDRCRDRLAERRAERDAWLARTDIRARVARLASAIEVEEDDARSASGWRRYWWIPPLVAAAAVAASMFALSRSGGGEADSPPEFASAEALEVWLTGGNTGPLTNGARVPIGARLAFHAGCGGYCNLTLFVLREAGSPTPLWPPAGGTRLASGPDASALDVEHEFRPTPDHELYVGLFCRLDMGERYPVEYLEKRFPLDAEGHRRLSDAESVGEWFQPLCRVKVQKLSRVPDAGGPGSAWSVARHARPRHRAIPRIERLTAPAPRVRPRVRPIRDGSRPCEVTETCASHADAGRGDGRRSGLRARATGPRGPREESRLLLRVASVYRRVRATESVERAVRGVVTMGWCRDRFRPSTMATGPRGSGRRDLDRIRVEQAHERVQEASRRIRDRSVGEPGLLLALLAGQLPRVEDRGAEPGGRRADSVLAAIGPLPPRLAFAPDGARALLEVVSRGRASLIDALSRGESIAPVHVTADRAPRRFSPVDRDRRRGGCIACVDVVAEREAFGAARGRRRELRAWPRVRVSEPVAGDPFACVLTPLARRGRDLVARLAGALAVSADLVIEPDGVESAIVAGSFADAASRE